MVDLAIFDTCVLNLIHLDGLVCLSAAFRTFLVVKSMPRCSCNSNRYLHKNFIIKI